MLMHRLTTLLKPITLALAVCAFAALAQTEARADGLVLLGPDPCFPAGVGRGCGPDRAPHVLSIQSPNNNKALADTATGSVGRGIDKKGNVGDVTTGDATRGANTRTVSLTEIGTTNASQIRIYYDINEPNGQDRGPITLNSLVLKAYNSAGQEVFSASLVKPGETLPELGNGQGHSDYVFGLDSAAAARLQAAIAQYGNLRLGLSASVTAAEGGPESFFIGSAQAEPIPEPATMILLGTGLVGVAAKVRRRRRAGELTRDI